MHKYKNSKNVRALQVFGRAARVSGRIFATLNLTLLIG